MTQSLLAYIESQITHYGNQLEKYMLAKQVVQEGMAKLRGDVSDLSREEKAAHQRAARPKSPPRMHPPVLREAIIQQLGRGPATTSTLIGALGMQNHRSSVYMALDHLKKTKMIVSDENGEHKLITWLGETSVDRAEALGEHEAAA